MNSWIKVLLYVCAVDGYTETNVSCVYRSSCTLPCSFRHETDNFRWCFISRTSYGIVHSFDKNRDQLEDQEPRFHGRTSLVEDELTGRKTALMLKDVNVQDEGMYKCFVISDYGIPANYVVLRVDAPVQRVNVVTSGNSITCSSEGVYPEPELTWSPSHQSNSTVQQTEEKLYNISSSLKLSDIDGDQLLNCTVSTRLNKTTSTWMKPISGTRSRFGLIAPLMGVAVVVLVLLFRPWKGRKEKLKNKKKKKIKGFADQSKSNSLTNCIAVSSRDPEDLDGSCRSNVVLDVDEVSDSSTASSSSSV